MSETLPFTSLFTPTGTATLAAGPVSTSVAFGSIGSAISAVIRNYGTATAFVQAGNPTVVATLASVPVLPGNVIGFPQGLATNIAAITQSGTVALTIESGTGDPEIVFAGLGPDSVLTDPIINGGTATDLTLIAPILSGIVFDDPVVTGGTFTDPLLSGATLDASLFSAGTVDGSLITTSTIDGAIINGGTATGVAVNASTIDLSEIENSTIGSTNITGGTIDSAVVTGLPAPINASDAATKSYVDAASLGLQVKQTATVATAAALPANTYANGASGVGATLTINATGTLTVDGYLTALTNVVLVKNEVSSQHNGLYVVTTAGASGVAAVLTRTTDMDLPAQFTSALIPVGSAGATTANSLWLANPMPPVTVGTTAIPFVQINNPTNWTAGPSITINGNQISVTAIQAGLVGSSGTSLTSVTINNAGLSLIAGVLANSGVTSIGGLSAAVGLGANLGVVSGALAVTNLGTAGVIASDGPVSRTLAARFGEVINLLDFYTGGGDYTAAMFGAIAQATTAGGGRIVMPAGTFNLAIPSPPSSGPVFRLPSNTALCGAGMDQTILTWNDANPSAFNLFSSTGTSIASPAQNVSFQDFTVQGSFATNGNRPAMATGGYPFLVGFVDKLRFNRVGLKFVRGGGIFTRGCTDVTVDGCELRYVANGAIDASQCTLVTINANTIMHCDDDAIAVHSSTNEPWTVRRNIIVTNNNIFQAQGISILSPRGVLISGNVIDCVMQAGINLSEISGVEGEAAADITVISGNVITNVIDRFYVDNLNTGSSGISISGASARPGALGVIPGLNITGSDSVPDPTIYFESNSTSSSVATALSRGYLIIGNTVARTLPASDGTATATGGTGQTYNSWSDYGLGPDPYCGFQMFTRLGLVNPSLPEIALRPRGVLIGGAAVRDALITGNHFRGLNAAVAIASTIAEKIYITNNTFSDCATGPASTGPIAPSPGVIVINMPSSLSAPAGVFVIGNFIDADPNQKAVNRLSHGNWNVNAALLYPGGVWIQAGSGVVVENNRFRNCMIPVQVANIVTQAVEISGNWLECNPGGTLNAGIGIIPLGGNRILQLDSDPASATYNQVLSVPVTQSAALPMSGYYLIGDIVKKTIPVEDANGITLTGWARLTNGTGQVLGTDWNPLYAFNSSLDITAVARVGASNGVIQDIVVSPLGTFQFYHDGTAAIPDVTISAAGAGGINASATIDQWSSQIVGIANTITASSTIQTYNSSSTLVTIPLLLTAGNSYADGETLTAVGGTSSVAFAGTIAATGTNGPVGAFVVTHAGNYSILPPATTVTFTGSVHGTGLQINIPLWGVVDVHVTSGGYFPNGTPQVTLPAFPILVQNSALLTPQMGESFHADTTGASIAVTTAYTLANGGTVTLTPSGGSPAKGPAIAIIEPVGGSISAGAIVVANEGSLASSYNQEIYYTGTIGTRTLLSAGTITFHGISTSASASPSAHDSIRYLNPGTVSPGWFA